MRRLMVVDDELFNVQALTGIIEMLGMKRADLIDVCFNGEQAVRLVANAIAENDIDRYSLILSDMSMPFMDGYEASKQIRDIISAASQLENQRQKLRIIAITGHVEPSYIQKARDCGID